MGEPPPPPLLVLSIYATLGALLSFLVGREPGTLPADLPSELTLSLLAICLHLVAYSVCDVMAVGTLKAKHDLESMPLKTYPKQLPAELLVALRAQANQVEQMTSFVVATLLFSVFVNGTVSALIATCPGPFPSGLTHQCSHVADWRMSRRSMGHSAKDVCIIIPRVC